MARLRLVVFRIQVTPTRKWIRAGGVEVDRNVLAYHPWPRRHVHPVALYNWRNPVERRVAADLPPRASTSAAWTGVADNQTTAITVVTSRRSDCLSVLRPM